MHGRYGEVYYTGERSGCPAPIAHENTVQKNDTLSNSLKNLEEDTRYDKKKIYWKEIQRLGVLRLCLVQKH